MRAKRLFKQMLGVETCVIENVDLGSEGSIRVSVRPYAKDASRCPHCQRKCPRYDSGKTRRWRSLDFGLAKVFVEAKAVRVQCREHGVVTAYVPWARAKSRFTRDFENLAVWLATKTDRSAVSKLLRVAWETVGRMCERVVEESLSNTDPFENVTHIGIDEVSYKRRYKYLTVVVDHHTGKLIYATEGHTTAAVESFFDALGPERSAKIELVSADASNAVRGVLRNRCPNATLCLDPFHIVMWTTKALDQVRRDIWRTMRQDGEVERPSAIQRSRFVLWKNPENLSDKEKAKLVNIQRLNKPLFRAYILKEQLRLAFKLKGDDGIAVLKTWINSAARCRLKPFVELAKRIKNHQESIEASLRHRLSNGRVEGINTSIRVLTRVAYGFHSPKALIALAYLKLGGFCPNLPQADPQKC